VSIPTLKNSAGPDFLRALRHKPVYSRDTARRCPLCHHRMDAMDMGTGTQAVTLDACWECQLIWFDPSEFQRVHPPPLPGDKAVAPPPFPKVAPARSQAGPPPAPETAVPDGPGDDRSGFGLCWPDSAWQFLPGILGMPIELGENRLRDRPVVTWGLAGAMTLIFVLLVAADRLFDAVQAWGFIPNEWPRQAGLTLVTSFFLHAGWWHLIGNMYFFVIFGDNVEDRLGWWKFALLLAAAHFGGLMLHSARGGAGDIPCVGASAGISGVIAYYAVVFRRAKIGVFGGVLTAFHFLRMPAIVGLVLYTALQLLGAYLSSGETAGVAYFAHLGGLGVGVGAGVLARVLREPATVRAAR